MAISFQPLPFCKFALWYLIPFSHAFRYVDTVNLEIFARILFSQIALKDIFFYDKNLQIEHDLPILVNKD